MAGGVALGRLTEERKAWRKNHPYGWRPAITVRQLLVGIQDLLDTPNPASPAQSDLHGLFTKNLVEYKKMVRHQAKLYPARV
ncbi:SUMO-conjugating enzyme Ubc9 [Cynara cardunculus var. scolymus]|uniref:SUMO-conjugating enzyme Ubc9 n=1 Tax=Cynara cardunculus var. scolymus TaxID=59895 RepID=A0A103XBW1_CYNCS|nr:SUMO-conjugating enzyme Ubc9 [Cynara cardunculus var. scolymus]